MKTKRFDQIYEGTLKSVFTREQIVLAWRSIVKNQLRSLAIKDIYDYYDFNYNIELRADAIRNTILEGEYETELPLIYKVEKKFGICRHIVIPRPTDALVMQLITEEVSHKILDHSSDNAFYSRDKHNFVKPHEFEATDYEYNWFLQWKKMQKTIMGFSGSKKFIVVTDITNYYDSIDMIKLREKVLMYVDDGDTVLIDILFKIIEEISWRPDYLPYNKKGLPTVNTEPVRLLGHSLLFEIDEVCEQMSNGCFTRWMDDITLGVDSRQEAFGILSSVSDVLKSVGIALNLSKTEILTLHDFRHDFLIDLNRYLDEFKSKDVVSETEKKKLKIKFKAHLRDTTPKHWSKVTKRFITTLSKYNLKISPGLVENLYVEGPNLREKLCNYLGKDGPTKQNQKIVLNIIRSKSLRDDVSLFFIAQLLTGWNIANTKSNRKFLNEAILSIDIQEEFHFYCNLWIRAKYDSPDQLLKFIQKFKPKWSKNIFLRRQVVGVLGRLLIVDSTLVKDLLEDQIKSGVIDAISLGNQILDFSELEKLDKKLSSYLFPSNLKKYGLQRFLVLCSALNTQKIRKNKDVQEKIKIYIKDPFFKLILEDTYGIKF